MREIKFRAWDKEDKSMGFPFSIYKTNMLAVDAENWVLMQFTGLKDKNGKEIYEGDILSYLAYSEKIRKDPKYLKVVEWIGAGFNIRNGENFEVMGDIYNNPELLEKK